MMDASAVVAGCRSHAWYEQVPPEEALGAASSMLSDNERCMLHWLAREWPLGEGASIVDAGCFLGGSTLALATGLARNPGISDKNYRIHSYDMFVAPNDRYALSLIGHGKKPGNPVIDLFMASLGPLHSHVVVHMGDIVAIPAPPGAIDILFVDVAKTRLINAHLLREFFPKMIPGRSILIQQDHNDHSCPWINATMEFLANHFEVLCDDRSSRVYQLTKPLPNGSIEFAATMPLDEEIRLLRNSIQQERNPVVRFFTATGLAWSIFERDGKEAASAYLDALPFEQPWLGDSYVDMIRGAMDRLGDAAGLATYHERYFTAR